MVEEADKITDPSRIAFMISKPENIVDTYCNRPDHKPFSDFIHSATDYEKAKATCEQTLTEINIQCLNYIPGYHAYTWTKSTGDRG